MNLNKNFNLKNIVNNYTANVFHVVKKPVVTLLIAGLMSYSLTSCNDSSQEPVINNSIISSNVAIQNGLSSSSNMYVNNLNFDSVVDAYYRSGLSVDSFNNLSKDNIMLELEENNLKVEFSVDNISVIRYYSIQN